MKKFFVYASLCTIAVSGYAEEVTPQQALARVFSSRADRGLLMAPVNNYKVVLTETLNDKKTLYVFSSPTQTLILPADDVVETPILGRFDKPLKPGEELPPVVKWWFGEYSRQIAWMAEHADVAEAGLSYSASLPKTTVKETYHDVAPLTTTKWGQDAPYNYFTPGDGKYNTVTCCVATAFAQVMNYHKYPTGPCKGTGSATLNWEPVEDMNLEGLVFDWANMKDTYTDDRRPLDDKDITPEQRAVATLMVACGFACKVNYGYDGSGAMTHDLVKGAINHFGYNKGMNIELRDFYTTDQWIAKLYKELTTNGPIIYGGWGPGPSSGHQFVLDGFDAKTQMLHFNWGWRGVSDGYFKLDALNPRQQGIGGGAFDFNTMQDAVFGFTPEYDGAEPGRPYVGFTKLPQTTIDGNNLKLSWLYGYEGIYNCSAFTSDVQIGISVTEAGVSTPIKTYNVLKTTMEPSINGTWIKSLDIPVPSDLKDGTYDLHLVYSYKEGKWEDLMTAPDLHNYYRIKKQDGVISIVDISAKFDVREDLPEDLYLGQKLSFNTTFSNLGNERTMSKVTPYAFVLTKDNRRAYEYQLDETRYLDLLPGESQEFSFNGAINYYLPDSTKVYIGYKNTDDVFFSIKEHNLIRSTSCFIYNHSLLTNNLEKNHDLRMLLGITNISSKQEMFKCHLSLVSKSVNNISYDLGDYTKQIKGKSSATADVHMPIPEDIVSGEYYLKVKINGLPTADFVEDVNVSGSSASPEVTEDATLLDIKYYDPATGRPVTPDSKEKRSYIRVSSAGSEKVVL